MALMTSKNHFLLKFTFLIFALGFVLAGCVDRISTLGAQYYNDTVSTSTSIRNDTSFMKFTDTVRPFVTTSPDGINSQNGIDYALADSTTLMIIGKVNNPYPGDNDNMESWALLQFPPLPQDTVSQITNARILLRDQNFKYGDSTSSNSSMVHYTVYQCYHVVTDSTYSIAMNQLDQPSVGSIDSLFLDTDDWGLPIPLNQAVFQELTGSTLGFVIVPSTPAGSMTNCRGFGTIHSYGDPNSVPQLQFVMNGTDTIYHAATVDFHIVHDLNMPPPGEFTLRGGAGERERINLNLTRPTDTAHLNAFTTINNAMLVLHIDPANSSHSNVSSDTLGPDIVQLGSVDSADHFVGNGYRDPSDTTDGLYFFQVRGIVQNWLADSALNYGFELRSGYSSRSFYGPDPETIGVEDNTVNRWTFYGSGYSDPTKRPYLILSYSKLK
jgi:hypothetical protein